jgi:hypothetical protein
VVHTHHANARSGRLGRPARLSGMSLSWASTRAMLARSKFGFLCPVSWAERREYVTAAAHCVAAGHLAVPAAPNGRATYSDVSSSHSSSRSSNSTTGVVGVVHLPTAHVVYYSGHLFACEDERAAAKLINAPDRLLRFQTPPAMNSNPLSAPLVDIHNDCDHDRRHRRGLSQTLNPLFRRPQQRRSPSLLTHLVHHAQRTGGVVAPTRLSPSTLLTQRLQQCVFLPWGVLSCIPVSSVCSVLPRLMCAWLSTQCLHVRRARACFQCVLASVAADRPQRPLWLFAWR